jgi:hypothetical protein
MTVPIAIGALVVAAAVVAVVVAVGAWRQASRSAERARALEALGNVARHAPGPMGSALRPSYDGPPAWAEDAYVASPGPLPRSPSRRPSPGPPARRRDSSSRWATAVLMVAAIDIAAAAVLGLSTGKTRDHTGAPRQLVRSAVQAPRHASPGAGSRKVAAPPPTAQPRHPAVHLSEVAQAPPPTSPAVLAGVGPVLAAISPASAAPGQVVTLFGSGFFSSDGRINVTFGGLLAPVHCPSRNVCKATVPIGKMGVSVPVALSTQSGTSNRLSFTYS